MALEPSQVVDNSQDPVTLRLDTCGLEFRSGKRGMLYLKYGMFYWQEEKKKKILLAPKGTL